MNTFYMIVFDLVLLFVINWLINKYCDRYEEKKRLQFKEKVDRYRKGRELTRKDFEEFSDSQPIYLWPLKDEGEQNDNP